MGLKQIGGMALPMIVLGPADCELKEVTNCKSPTEGPKQTEASKASETAFFADGMKVPRAFGHVS
jgi:hypothetical protein